MSDQGGSIGKFSELAALQSRDAQLRSAAQRFQFVRLLYLAVFDEAQTFSHDFAGVLIPPASDESYYQGRLTISQNDIARRLSVPPLTMTSHRMA